MKHPVLTSWERLMFIGAAAILGGLTLEVVLLWLADPALGQGVVRGMAAEIVTGREGGIPVALGSGVPRLLVFQVSLCQDLAFAFLVFPFFLHALHRYHDAENVVMRRIRRIEAAAQRHEAYLDRWGPFGVFLFMLVPFLINGPLVGLMLGRIGGIPSQRLLLPVVAATAVAAAAWTYFYDSVFRLARTVHPNLGAWIALGVLVVLVALILVDVWRDARRRRGQEEP